MAARTPEFREKVLKLDNYHCQICGFDGRDEKNRGFLEADHVIPRAGKASMDDPSNGMTLCVLCHKKKTDKDIIIMNWDREDKENGFIATDAEGNPLSGAWFYSEADRELLEHGLEALRLIASGESQKARILAHIWSHFNLTDASSPAQLVSQVGLDPNECGKIANTFISLEKMGIEWPNGMNLQKATLALECAERIDREIDDERIENLQELICYASQFSYTDFEKELIDGGFLDSTSTKTNKENLYIWMPRMAFNEEAVVFRGGDEQMAARCAEDAGIAIKIGGVVRPLHKHSHKLSIKNGLIDEDVEIVNLR